MINTRIMEDSFFNSLSAGDIFQQEGEQLVRVENRTGRNNPCPCGRGKNIKNTVYQIPG